MAITITDLKNKVENLNNALNSKGKTAQVDIMRSNAKGYNIKINHTQASITASTVAVGLTGKEANIWLDGFFTSLYN